MNIGEIVRCVVSYSRDNASVSQNVFFFKWAGSPQSDTDALTSLDNYFTNQFGVIWKSLGSQDCTVENVAVDVLNNDGTVARNVGNAPLAFVGNVLSQVASAAVSYYMGAYTGVPKQRGSKYVPGVAESLIDEGGLTAGAQTALLLLLTWYFTTGNVGGGATVIPGILSRTLNTFIPFVTTGFIETVPAYQRRRKPGVGI